MEWFQGSQKSFTEDKSIWSLHDHAKQLLFFYLGIKDPEGFGKIIIIIIIIIISVCLIAAAPAYIYHHQPHPHHYLNYYKNVTV